MAQAKKKTTAKKTTTRAAKTPKASTRKPVKAVSAPKRTRTSKSTGHADHDAKSLVAWAVLGLVAVAFTMWILTDYKNLQDTFNSVDEGSATTMPRKPDAHPKDMQH